MAFFQNILKKLSPGKIAPAPAISLAAFGKHPGWDDHTEDLGAMTPLLAQFKRSLYFDAISQNLDSRAWERLAPAQRLETFNHIVLFLEGPNLVLARFWPSVDGKGRALYPMVAAAHCASIGVDFALERVLPALEEVQQRVAAATHAADVRSQVGTAAGALAAMAAEAPQPPSPAPAIDPLTALADCPAIGADRKGLYAVTYHFEHEAAPWLAGRMDPKVGARSAMARLPRAGLAPARALAAWLGFAERLFDPAAPLLMLLPVEQEFVDLLIGPPTAALLFCLRASVKSIPLTSDIPYNMDGAFMARVAPFLAARA